eukprot:1153111-Ditylum_brightwellii.AAC.1
MPQLVVASISKAKFTVNMLKPHLSKLRCRISGVSSVQKYGITVQCLPDVEATKVQLHMSQK